MRRLLGRKTACGAKTLPGYLRLKSAVSGVHWRTTGAPRGVLSMHWYPAARFDLLNAATKRGAGLTGF